jgi:hypothetical protein
LSESVIITGGNATEAYSGLDLARVKYSINKSFMLENDNAVVQIKSTKLSNFL